MDNETKQDRLERAVTWHELTKLPAWKLMQQYYAIQIQSFANDILLGEEEITKYERSRYELSGIRKLFAMIETEVEYLRNESDKKDSGTHTNNG